MADSWQDRAVTWPIGRVSVVVAAFGTVVGVPVFWLVEPRVPPIWRIATGVGFGLFLGAWMGLLLYVVRRRETRSTGELATAARIDLNHALRVGEAPRDPALDEVALALIGRRRDQTERSQRWTPWLWGVVLILMVVQVIIQPDVFHLVLLAFYAAFPVVIIVSVRRARARMDRAERAIRARRGE